MNKIYIILSVIIFSLALLASCDDNMDEIITEEIEKSEAGTGSSGSNSIAGKWVLLKNTGISLKNAASAEYNGWLYIHGGENALGTVNTFWRINLTSGVIESLGEDIFLSGHDMAVMDGILYLFGGKDENGDAVRDFWTYDLDNIGSPGWIVEITVSDTNGPFPPARYGHRTVADNGYFYVFGGIDDLGIMDSALYLFDPLGMEKPRWEKLTTDGPLITGAGLIIQNDYIYVFGGFDSTGLSGNNYVNSLWIYNIVLNTWTLEAVPTFIKSRGWVHSVIVNNRMITLWGENNSGTLNESISYNPAGTWSIITNGPDARSFYTLSTWGNKAVVYGGYNSNSSRFFDDIWILSFE